MKTAMTATQKALRDWIERYDDPPGEVLVSASFRDALFANRDDPDVHAALRFYDQPQTLFDMVLAVGEAVPSNEVHFRAVDGSMTRVVNVS